MAVMIILSLYPLMFVTWVAYLAVMNLKAHLPTLSPVARAHAYVLLAAGLLLDALTNITVGSLLFAGVPSILQVLLVASSGGVVMVAAAVLQIQLPSWMLWALVAAVFAEPPNINRLLLTARLTYHIRNAANDPRRAKVAGWLCFNLLDQFDEPSGKHCG